MKVKPISARQWRGCHKNHRATGFEKPPATLLPETSGPGSNESRRYHRREEDQNVRVQIVSGMISAGGDPRSVRQFEDHAATATGASAGVATIAPLSRRDCRSHRRSHRRQEQPSLPPVNAYSTCSAVPVRKLEDRPAATGTRTTAAVLRVYRRSCPRRRPSTRAEGEAPSLPPRRERRQLPHALRV